MVVGLVLELKEPLLCGHLTFVINDIHVNIDAACIVLLADLHIVEKTLSLEVTGTDAGHVHEVDVLVLTAELLTDLKVEVECSVDLLLEE